MYDVIVAGGGPAGLSAALYAARAGRSVLVLEKSVAGGQIVYSPMVENYPGLPSLSGAEFSQKLTAQVEALGVELEYAALQGFHAIPGGWAAETEDGERQGRALVLALGADHRHLGLEGEADLTGRGISYCAVCDGPFYRDRDVAVIGGGDTALQDALFLSNVCRRVTLVHRREQFRGEASRVQRLRERGNVELLLGWAPAEFLKKDDGSLGGLRLRRADGDGTKDLDVAGVFIAVGQTPGTQCAQGRLNLDAGGYFPAGEDCVTELQGVFAAGDCRAKTVRQLTTAVGDGAVAGLAAARYAEGAEKG